MQELSNLIFGCPLDKINCIFVLRVERSETKQPQRSETALLSLAMTQIFLPTNLKENHSGYKIQNPKSKIDIISPNPFLNRESQFPNTIPPTYRDNNILLVRLIFQQFPIARRLILITDSAIFHNYFFG